MPEIDVLLEMEFEDPELEPVILPIDARLSLSGTVDDFRALFERLTSIIPTKETLPGTSFVHVRAQDGVVRFMATDGSQTLIIESDKLRINREGAALLPGDKLKSVFKLAPDGVIALTLVGNVATITLDQLIWSIATPAGTNPPTVPNIDDIQMYPVPRRSFVKALYAAKRALPTLGSRKSLEQANVTKGTITVSDGYRLIRQRIDKFPPELSFALPKDTVEELSKSLVGAGADYIEMGSSDTLIVVKSENETLVSRQLVLDFPDLEPLLITPALENQNSVIVDSSELRDLVKRVRVSADQEYASVTMHFGMTKSGEWELTVQARDRSGNSASGSMFAIWEGAVEPFDLTLNHRYLVDLLDSYSGSLATLRVGTNSKTRAAPLLLRDDEVGFTGVVQQSLVR